MVRIHTELFSLLMREIAKTSLEERAQLQLQQQQQQQMQQGQGLGETEEEDAPQTPGSTRNASSSSSSSSSSIWDNEGVHYSSCDNLEATCHELFCSSDRSIGLMAP